MVCCMGVVALCTLANRLMLYLLGKDGALMAVKANLGGKGLNAAHQTEQENSTGEVVKLFTVHFAPPE